MNKKVKIFIILGMTLLMTGCTKSFTVDKKVYTENILCLPEKAETIKIYNENKIDISNLSNCNEFSINNTNYEGVWNTVFVNPLAWLLINIGNYVKSYGFSIILVTLLLRLLVMPVTAKTAVQSENMKKARPDLEELEKKYKNLSDRESLMKKSQEQMTIYKKHNIKPLAGCLFAFIQIPLFFAFFEAINRVPVLFEENFLGLFELRRSPIEAINLGDYYYLIFVILVIATTYFSFKLNQTASMSKEQEKQMKVTMNIMIVFISIMSFSLSTGIGLYWIFNSGFTILQNLFFKFKKEYRNVRKI